jgi:putative acetyltransferase
VPIAIRPYTETDLERVISAWENAARIAHPFVSEDFMDRERSNIPTLYLPNADTWVAEVEGTVVGFIAMMGNEVGAIFVEPDHQGHGVGQTLMNRARTLHDELEVEVFEANHIGRRFYERYGFRSLGRHFHDETGQTLLRLRFKAMETNT